MKKYDVFDGGGIRDGERASLGLGLSCLWAEFKVKVVVILFPFTLVVAILFPFTPEFKDKVMLPHSGNPNPKT